MSVHPSVPLSLPPEIVKKKNVMSWLGIRTLLSSVPVRVVLLLLGRIQAKSAACSGVVTAGGVVVGVVQAALSTGCFGCAERGVRSVIAPLTA